MFISGQQLCIADIPQLALLFLQLCPEESAAVHVIFTVIPGTKPLLPLFTIFAHNSKDRGRAAGKHEARRGLVVVCCAWRVGHVGRGAGNDFIVLVPVKSCTERIQHGTSRVEVIASHSLTLRSSFKKHITSWRQLRRNWWTSGGQGWGRQRVSAASPEIFFQYFDDDWQLLQALWRLLCLKAKEYCGVFELLFKMTSRLQHTKALHFETFWVEQSLL